MRIVVRLLWFVAGLAIVAWFAVWGAARDTGRPVASSKVTSQPQVAAPRAAAPLDFTPAFTNFLPVANRGIPAAPAIGDLVVSTTIALPQALGPGGSSFCTWTFCAISPRLYHEPLGDGSTLLGWTDDSGNGHVSVIGAAGDLGQTFDFAGQSVRGLVAHADGTFALLLWDDTNKIMSLTKRAAGGSPTWSTNINGPATNFDPTIGDSRLTYGDGKYAAYFAVKGVAAPWAPHNGDQLTFVNDGGAIQAGTGWEWGCSHSMAELVSYHPTLAKFMPLCSSDCFASKGILINDSTVVYQCDGNCGGLVSAQFGQVAISDGGWKLIFNALDRPGITGKGIGFATIDSSFNASLVWLTNTDGSTERDPVLARLGSSLGSNRYLVGWTTTNDNARWLGVIDGSGAFVQGPVDLSAAGVAWGNRDDSFRTRADGNVSWVQGSAGSTTLHLFRFNGAAFLP